MKKFLYILFFLTLMRSVPAVGQQPDLSKIKDQKLRTEAWLAYCDSAKRLLAARGFGNSPASQNLTSIAREGLAVAATDDAASRAKLFAYAAQGFFYENPMNGDSVKFYYNKSFEEAKKSGSALLIINATVALMHISFEMEGSKNSQYLKSVLQKVTDTTKDKEALAKGFAALGNFYQQKSYYSTSQDFYLKSILILKNQMDSTNDSQVKADYVNECYTLAQLYVKTGSPDQALGMLREGEAVPGIPMLIQARYKSQFIKLFTLTGHIDSALYYFDKYIRPLETQFLSAREVPYEIILSNLSIGEYYLNKGLVKEAFPFIEKGNRLGRKSGQPVFSYKGEILTGKYYFKTGDYKNAIASLSSALPEVQQFSREDFAEAIKYMGLSLQAQGKYADAIKYFIQYANALDSFTAEKISVNLADEATRYETGRKESRIKYLDNETRLREVELQKANRTRLLLIVGLGALAIICLLLYFIYRNREKANKILNARNLQLDYLNNELSVANETKAILFGVIGHDLRAPVARIVQLLQLQKSNDDQLSNDEFAERIQRASEKVLETMEDLLLWSKSQMKNFTPQFRMVNGKQLVNQEIELMMEEINEKKLSVDLKSDHEITYQTDENFLAVIIRNILQNAIRHSPAGKVIEIELLKDKIVIINEREKPAAGKLNLLLERKNVDSQKSGFGLQMSRGLADKIGLKIRFFEIGNDRIAARLEW